MAPLGFALNLGQRSVGLLGGGAVVLYLAGRAAADAVGGGGDRPPSGGRLAVGHWLPVGILAAVATATGQFGVAVGIVFATAVGCLSLGIGALAAVAPVPVTAPAAGRRTWPLLVPAAVLPLLAGFHRSVRGIDAIALAVEGLVVLLLWVDRPAAGEPAAVVGRPMPLVLRGVELVVAVGLSAVGAGLAVQGLLGSAVVSEAATPGLLTATVLAPLMVLPILGTAADLAARGPAAASQAASALVGVGLLDACLGLPIVVGLAAARAKLVDALRVNPELLWGWHDWPRWLGVAVAPVLSATTRPDAAAVPAVSALVPFPLAVWRVDVVVLLALAAALLPVALGRYALTRGQGFALIGAYAAYLFLALRVGIG